MNGWETEKSGSYPVHFFLVTQPDADKLTLVEGSLTIRKLKSRKTTI